MSKFILLLGIVLIIISVPILFIGILDPENSPFTEIIGSIACKPPEKIVTETTNWSQPNGESGSSTEYFCEIEPGQRRDVMETAFLVLGGSFAVPLVAGILMTIIGANGVARQATKQMTSNINDYFSTYPPQQTSSSTVINLRDKKGEIPPEAQEILNDVLGGFTTAFTQAGSKGTLSDRLEQLNEAYNNDLISKEEYERIRQAILDSMDD